MPKHYAVTKRYPHSLGLSACFRQWRATSHCNQLHGYALAFDIEYRAKRLDHCNWVIDFGGLKSLKDYLVRTFDHRLLVAEDDPRSGELYQLSTLGLANVLMVPAVGCEAFAEMVGQEAAFQLSQMDDERWESAELWVHSVKCSEHDGNSATWFSGLTG